MIRRDVRLADGSPGWALVSQIEHARISGQLAALCGGRLAARALAGVRDEALAAIRSHDDGWAEWEASPRQHAVPPRPVSFMELEPDEALAVWTRSVDRAAVHGPLAGWMVAGHFCRLLEKHTIAHRGQAAARAWYDAMQRRRGEWLASWHAAEPELHTAAVAAEALQWLWTFDEVSLWFCCTCPSAGEPLPPAPRPYAAGVGTPIEMHLAAAPGPAPAGGAGPPGGGATAAPWRFTAEAITLEAAVRVVPAVEYDDAAALLAAGEPRTLAWRLAPGEPGPASAAALAR